MNRSHGWLRRGCLWAALLATGGPIQWAATASAQQRYGTPEQIPGASGSGYVGDQTPAAYGSGTNVARRSVSSPPVASYWNFSEMDIPITLGAGASNLAEVNLLVSRDGGVNWNRVSTEPPTSKAFHFQPTDDGDYWFATQTVDSYGRVAPTGPIAPMLRITVDRAKPELKFDAAVDPDNNVTVGYAVRDGALGDEPIRVLYQRDTDLQWSEAVSADHSPQPGTEKTRYGTYRWNLSGEWRKVHLRVQVRDAAGNESNVTKTIERPRVAAMQVPGRLASNPQIPPPPAASAAPQLGVSPRGHARPAATPVAAPVAPPPLLQSQSQPNPSPTSVDLDVASDASEGSDFSEFLGPQQWAAQDVPPLGEGPSGGIAEEVVGVPVDPRQALRPYSESAPTQADQQDPAALEGGSLSDMPSDEAPRTSRTKTFSLDYDVDSTGSSGVNAVELWGTRDGGKTWNRWGADEDRQSPFDIATGGEGLYGFRIVVVAGNGLTSPRPTSGEPADLFVLVDETLPKVQLTAAEYGMGNNAGHLVLRWEASDENLGDNPIRLLFSPSSEGPWTTIAAGLENSGQYAWPADPTLPAKIFVKVEVEDQAGNVASNQLPGAIAVEGLAPRGKIRGFKPIDSKTPQASRSAPAAPRGRFR
jgi:hypothetical protein